MILKKEVIIKLSRDLSLPYTGTEQDWPIEMADTNRINEFLAFYKNSTLTNDEKEGLISLILASYDDFLQENDLYIDHTWYVIKEIMKLEISILSKLIDYWSLDNEVGKDNIFRITPLIREIKTAW